MASGWRSSENCCCPICRAFFADLILSTANGEPNESVLGRLTSSTLKFRSSPGRSNPKNPISNKDAKVSHASLCSPSHSKNARSLAAHVNAANNGKGRGSLNRVGLRSSQALSVCQVHCSALRNLGLHDCTNSTACFDFLSESFLPSPCSFCTNPLGGPLRPSALASSSSFHP